MVLYGWTVIPCLYSGSWVASSLHLESMEPTASGVGLLVLVLVVSACAGLFGSRLGARFVTAGFIADGILGISSLLALCAAAYLFSAFNTNVIVAAVCFRLISPTLLYLSSRVPAYVQPRTPPRRLLARTAQAALGAIILVGTILALIWTIR